MPSRFLLDTHLALWWFSDHPRLSEAAREQIAAGDCALSAASVWEVAIKYRLGKLPVSPADLLAATAQAQMRVLPVAAEHAAATAHLPDIHADPFDRLLLAQANGERLVLLTADRTLAAYGGAVQLVE